MRLIIEKVTYQNFLSTGNVPLEINFSKDPMTLIVGSNGSGKSTVIDALTFALFNKPYRNINKNQLVNSINRKDCVVEAYFNTSKHQYLVRRGIKPALFEIYQDGTMINKNADSRDYQSVLENEILKLSYKAFVQTIVIGSATYVPFMQLPSQHRRDIIEDLLGIRVFSQMNVILKSYIQDNKDSLGQLEYQIKLQQQKISGEQKRIASLSQNNDQIVTELTGKIDDQQKVRLDNQHVLSLYEGEEAKLNKSISDYNDVQKKYNLANKALTTIQTKLQTVETFIQFIEHNDSCPTCHQDISNKQQIVEQNISSRDKHLSDIEEVKRLQAPWIIRLDEISGIRQEISELDQLIRVTVSMDNQSRIYIEQLQSQIDNAKQQVIEHQTNSNIEQLLEQLQVLQSNKSDLLNEQEVHKLALALLKDTGIKTKIINQYIPVINQLINKYLAAMDFFVNFELDQSFQETIKSRYRDIFGYNSFSEGEKFKIDLSVMLTWRAIAKLRNSTSCNLLILDEVFDSSLDNTGTDDFMKIIKSLSQDTNVFIISHKTHQLTDQFANVLKFEKQKNFSSIVVGE